jgi:probable rRNA maturation factor
MPREILIANRHPRLRLNRRAVARVIHTLDANSAAFRPKGIAASPKKKPSPIAHHPSPTTELSVVFLTDPALAQLHADFLADPTPTDVITFEGDPTQGTAGEICVSVDAAIREVGPRRDFSAELTLYLVHGWLHLAGFDDLLPAKKRQMRRAEARAMKLLRSAGALPEFSSLR